MLLALITFSKSTRKSSSREQILQISAKNCKIFEKIAKNLTNFGKVRNFFRNPQNFFKFWRGFAEFYRNL